MLRVAAAPISMRPGRPEESCRAGLNRLREAPPPEPVAPSPFPRCKEQKDVLFCFNLQAGHFVGVIFLFF